MKLLGGLLQSEATYLNELDTLVKVVVEPLRQSQILDRKSTMEIVSTTEFIHKVNSYFLGQLQAYPKDVLFKKIGSIFLSMV